MIIIFFIIIIAALTYAAVTRPKLLSKLRLASSSENIVSIDDAYLRKLQGKANRYYVQREFLAAEKAYLKILKIDHKNLEAYNRLGFIYAHTNNFADAIECFKIVVDSKPDAVSYHNLGMVYLKSRDFTKAAVFLEKSSELKPEPIRLVSLARVYRILNKFSLQISTLKKALEIDKKNIQIMQLLADAYLHNKNKKEANNLFKKISKIDPQNLRAHEELAKTQP